MVSGYADSERHAARPSSDPRIADLVRAGKLRVALFPPQYAKNPTTGGRSGVWLDVARALAADIGVPLEVIEVPAPDRMIECLAAGGCDLGSLGFDPVRAGLVGGFSPPFMQVDYTLLVPAGSAIRSFADADRPGIRIAAVRHHASTLALGRILKQAEEVGVDTPEAAFDLLRGSAVDAWASIRPLLMECAGRLPGARVLDDGYGANLPALVVPKGHEARLSYVSEFVERSTASGLMRKLVECEPGYRAAPRCGS